MYFRFAWRNLWRNPRRTGVILTAIFVGVASMIFLGAVSRGSMTGMVDNAIGDLTGHLQVRHPEYRGDPALDHRIDDPLPVLELLAEILPSTARIAPRLRVDAVVSTARKTAGVVLVGIDPGAERGSSFIAAAPLEGEYLRGDDNNGILVGSALMGTLGIRRGSKVVLMSQGADGELASMAFRIRGVYHADLAATEKRCVFVPLAAARRLLGVERAVTEVAVTLPGTTFESDLPARLARQLNGSLVDVGLTAAPWRELLPAMSAYLGMFDFFLLIWYLVVFVAMGFGIANTVLMAVFERMREFGLLRALGMRPRRIFFMVLGETLLLLVLGLAAGNLAGGAGVVLLNRTGLDLSAFARGAEMWGMTRIVWPRIALSDLLLANGTVLVLGVLTGVYPALKAAQFTPVETMRRT
ncbi:MAG: ABC transporter permease [Deltaproteobacteria bacterium]|nr:ABC transporter permease [Candidatus Anaeroferrophillacea bacterium]